MILTIGSEEEMISVDSLGNAAKSALFVRFIRYGLFARRDIIPVRVGLRLAVRIVVDSP